MEKIVRNLGNIELRALESPESRTITGYAVVFDSESQDLGGFIEIIKHGAIT
jgi:phage head maturation protease